MPMYCDGGNNENEVCESCVKAQEFSVTLTDKLLEYTVNKNLSEIQRIQAICIAALTSIEVIAGKENKLDATFITSELVSDWAYRITNSQKLELKNSNNVANIIRGTKTLN